MRRVLTVFLFVVAASNLSLAQQDSAASLAIRIVPSSFTENGTRGITLIDPAQHFSVVVTNTGKETIRLWRESCSWGYANLSFQAQDENGVLTTVTKKPRGWEKNVPDWILIPPGDHLVFQVAFDTDTWQNSPLPRPGQQRRVSLRALYESAADDDSRANKVWTGKIMSPQHPYTIFR